MNLDEVLLSLRPSSRVALLLAGKIVTFGGMLALLLTGHQLALAIWLALELGLKTYQVRRYAPYIRAWRSQGQ